MSNQEHGVTINKADRETKRNSFLEFKPAVLISNQYEIVSEQKVLDHKFSVPDPTTISLENGMAKPIGSGGSGVVYLAQQKLGQGMTIPRAIKFFMYRDDIVELHPSSGPVPSEAFKAELLNLTSVNHENIVKIIDARFHNIQVNGNEIEVPFLVMEYIEGPTLKDIIDKKLLEEQVQKSPSLVMDMIVQIGRGLEYLHRQGFVHCDIAPKNIFIQGWPNDCRVVIGDLGICRSLKLIGENDVVFVAGTKNYCPRRVQMKLNTKIFGSEFIRLQPEWDLYALTMTIVELALSLEPSNSIRRSWYKPIIQLQRCLNYFKFDMKRFSNTRDLLNYLEWLSPAKYSLTRSPELNDDLPGSRSILLPLEQVIMSPRIEKIFNHTALIRLRHVTQLPFPSAVFPSATHTRYEHSLGTYQTARRYLRSFLNDEHFLSDCDASTVELALLSAVLSSITYFPFSYAINELKLTKGVNGFEIYSKADILHELLEWPGNSDDSRTLKQLIKDEFPEVNVSELIDILSDNQDKFINQAHSFVHFMLHSTIDARVVDFLRRDALHLGVHSGPAFDIRELLRQTKYYNGRIAIYQRGIHIVEQIVTLRYWLFQRVYWNRPNRCFTSMLKFIIASMHILEKDTFDKDLRKIILNGNENDILCWLKDKALSVARLDLVDLCELLLCNNPIQFIEIDSFSRRSHRVLCDTFANRDFLKTMEVLNKLNRELISNYELPTDRVHVLVDIPIEPGKKKLGEDIDVLFNDGELSGNLLPLSDLVNGVNMGFDSSLQRVRLFLHPETYKIIPEPRKNISSVVLHLLEQER